MLIVLLSEFQCDRRSKLRNDFYKPKWNDCFENLSKENKLILTLRERKWECLAIIICIVENKNKKSVGIHKHIFIDFLRLPRPQGERRKSISFYSNIQFLLIGDSSLLRLMADSFGMTIHFVFWGVVMEARPGEPPLLPL